MKYLIIILLLFNSYNLIAAKYLISNLNEFETALIKGKPGDILIWKNGTYKDVKIDFKLNGTALNPIILKTETAGKVILTGNSQLLLNGEYLQAEGFVFSGTSTLTDGDVMAFSTNSFHCRITNCAVINYTPINVMVNNNWISLQGTYNELDHCCFSGKTNQGPYLVVRYKKEKGYVDGSNMAPSTYHHIHHNYFGYRTLPTDNGGEDMRIGDSFTSFTHGFNIIENNYFEDHRLEAEVISNKSWDNIYRFNTFINNDGQMVLRHGQKCFVYGNYFNGKTGRNTSGGIRIINANQTVFNNYIANAEASDKEAMKGGIVVMSGLEGSPLNGYYPADNAVVAYNTAINCAGPVVKLGLGNKTKKLPLVAPKNLNIVSNLIIGSMGKNDTVVTESEPVTYAICKDNLYTDGKSGINGFSVINKKSIQKNDGFDHAEMPINQAIIDTINQRLAIHHIHLSTKEIIHFDPAWKLTRKDVGASWMR